MLSFITRTKSFIFQEDGATVVEYGLLIVLIAIVTLAVLYQVGVNVFDLFYKIFITLLTLQPF